jgi:hypothetical protein
VEGGACLGRASYRGASAGLTQGSGGRCRRWRTTAPAGCCSRATWPPPSLSCAPPSRSVGGAARRWPCPAAAAAAAAAAAMRNALSTGKRPCRQRASPRCRPIVACPCRAPNAPAACLLAHTPWLPHSPRRRPSPLYSRPRGAVRGGLWRGGGGGGAGARDCAAGLRGGEQRRGRRGGGGGRRAARSSRLCRRTSLLLLLLLGGARRPTSATGHSPW